MRIAEIYSSRQGEGLLTGMPSVFVRASGCNLRCWFCDTPYTSWEPEGEDWSVEEIFREIKRLVVGWAVPTSPLHFNDSNVVGTAHPTIRHVVITGGEPMLFAELIPLCEKLRAANLHMTIETAGTLYLPVKCDLMSISPKLASSTPSEQLAGKWSARHEHTRHQPDVIRHLLADYSYQLKFVIDTPADCEAVQIWLAEFPTVDRSRVLLMPQGTDQSALARIGEWLAPYCREQGFVFCPRKHIEWYGATRGT
jgi:7-carboxy-7-deazaguanine synthase